MKFGKALLSLMIAEWKDKYINYNKLKSILKKATKLTKNKYTIKYEKFTANNIKEEEILKLKKFQEEFFKLFYKEFDKFTNAFLYIFYGMKLISKKPRRY